MVLPCEIADTGIGPHDVTSSIANRFVFFTKEDEESEQTPFESLLRSDRRAIQSVASALRIETEEEDEEDLFDIIMDPSQGI